MLRCNWVPCSLNNYFQKLLVNVGSPSKTMECGIVDIIHENVVHCGHDEGMFHRKKMRIFGNMINHHHDDYIVSGFREAQSIEISHQIEGRMGSIVSMLGDLNVYPLLC
jgi:hypothetical protein